MNTDNSQRAYSFDNEQTTQDDQNTSISLRGSKRTQFTPYQVQRQIQNDDTVTQQNILLDADETLSHLLDTMRGDDIDAISSVIGQLKLLLSRGEETVIQNFINSFVAASGIDALLAILSKTDDNNIIQQILYSLINISTIDTYSDSILLSGSLDILLRLSRSPDSAVSRETWWLLANCSYDNPDMSDFLFENGIISAVVHFLSLVLQLDIHTAVPHQQHLAMAFETFEPAILQCFRCLEYLLHSVSDIEILLSAVPHTSPLFRLLVCLLASNNQEIIAIDISVIFTLISTHSPFLNSFLAQLAPFFDADTQTSFVGIVCSIVSNFFPQIGASFHHLDIFQVFLRRRRSLVNDSSISVEQVRAERSLFQAIGRDIQSVITIITNCARLVMIFSTRDDDVFGEATHIQLLSSLVHGVLDICQLLLPKPASSPALSSANSILESLRNGQTSSIPPQFAPFTSVLQFEHSLAPIDIDTVASAQDGDRSVGYEHYIQKAQYQLLQFSGECMKNVFCTLSNCLIGSADIRHRLVLATFPQHPDGTGLPRFILEVLPLSTSENLLDLQSIVFNLSITDETVGLVLNASLVPAVFSRALDVYYNSEHPEHIGESHRILYGTIKYCLLAAEGEFREAVMNGTSSGQEGFVDGRFEGNRLLLQLKEAKYKEYLESRKSGFGAEQLRAEILELFSTSSGYSALFS
ncbi:hypothetical protein BLNAU_13095 [Blattamonas nauphoetae]|uniref:Uncharacterized protein n=1 Tax=Blattamonas nauphoetae TaxID=2049346 RepID=A0ABQ9XKJ7_9EUKA|nr:hypothetical protein BLNAU_13095 [Blattamonas nauphoetae]